MPVRYEMDRGRNLIMTGRTIKSHSRSFDTAPSCRAGDIVRFVHDDEKNPGWFFGDSDGVEGYFPTSWFRVDREAGRATALRDYDATELTIAAGASVDVLRTEAGWSLVRASGERIGWVPASCIEK